MIIIVNLLKHKFSVKYLYEVFKGARLCALREPPLLSLVCKLPRNRG